MKTTIKTTHEHKVFFTNDEIIAALLSYTCMKGEVKLIHNINVGRANGVTLTTIEVTDGVTLITTEVTDAERL